MQKKSKLISEFNNTGLNKIAPEEGQAMKNFMKLALEDMKEMLDVPDENIKAVEVQEKVMSKEDLSQVVDIVNDMDEAGNLGNYVNKTEERSMEELLKEAKDLGIIAIGSVIINPELLIKSVENKISSKDDREI